MILGVKCSHPIDETPIDETPIVVRVNPESMVKTMPGLGVTRSQDGTYEITPV